MAAHVSLFFGVPSRSEDRRNMGVLQNRTQRVSAFSLLLLFKPNPVLPVATQGFSPLGVT